MTTILRWSRGQMWLTQGQADGVELHDLDAVGPQFLEVVLLERLVVGVVAEAVECSPYLHALLVLLAQYVEEQRGDGVVAEVEVLQVYALLGLSDILEHQFELVVSRLDDGGLILVGEVNAELPHLAHYQRVARLG